MPDYTNFKPLRVSLITDTHYYSKVNGAEGAAYERERGQEQTLIGESSAVIKEAWDVLSEEGMPEIVLIPGDLTCNGDYASHAEFLALLDELKGRGKRIILFPGGHDYKDAERLERCNEIRRKKGDQLEEYTADAYRGDTIFKIPVRMREEVEAFYRPYGWDEAIARFAGKPCSYTVQLAEGYRLLALDDGYGNEEGEEDSCGYTEAHMAWIKAQVEDAHKNGQYIFAMAHHPVLSPSSIYPIMGPKDIILDNLKRASQFADMGLNLILTGHTHVHNIAYHVSAAGNVLFNVSTGALVGYPPAMRILEFSPATDEIRVESRILQTCKYLDTGGLSLPLFIRGRFFGLLEEMLRTAAAGDWARFEVIANMMSVRRSTVNKWKWLIKPAARYLSKLRIGKVGNWTRAETGLKKRDYADIQEEKVVPFIMEIVTQLWGGDPNFHPDTNQYKIAMGLMAIFDSLLAALRIDLKKLVGYATVSEMIDPLIYNAGICDDHAVLPISRERTAKLYPPPPPYKPPFQSRKGPKILVALVLGAVLLSPLLLPAGLLLGACMGLKKLFKKKPAKAANELVTE